MLSGKGRHRRLRPNRAKRLITTAAVTGVGATLPVIAAGGASAHTLAVSPTAAKPLGLTTEAAEAAAPAQVHQASATQQAAPATYTVVSGDWLSKIAEKHNVQGGWEKLYDLNRSVVGQNPNRIFPGEKLVLSGTTTPATPAPAPKAPAHTQAQAQAQAPKAIHTTSAPAAPVSYSGPASLRALAASIVPADQLASFEQIVSHESSWNVTATNASSGAYGLVQALPGSKMASAGADWRTNPATQIRWGLNYMNSRYGSPNQAWAFWQVHHWY